jgi:hypothetical protein
MFSRIIAVLLLVFSNSVLFAQVPCFDAKGSNGVRRGCLPFTISITECTGGGVNLLYKYSESEGFVTRTTNTYNTAGFYSITQSGSFSGQGDSLRKNSYIEVLATPLLSRKGNCLRH